MNYDLKRKLSQAASAQVPQVDLWADIRQKAVSGNTKQPWPAARSWKFALGAVGLVILALVISPGARALAQGIMQQIGNIKFVPEAPPSLPDRETAGNIERDTAQSKPSAAMSELDQEAYEKYGLTFSEGLTEEQKAAILAEFASRPDTIKEAEDLMGAEVLQPSFIPAGYLFSKIEAYKTDAGVLSSYTFYAKHDQNGELLANITLSQTLMPENAPAQFGTWPVGEEAQISDTTVRGQPAKYVQGAEISIVPQDILSWQEGEFDFSIIATSGKLTLEELQLFAASLE